MNNDGNTFPQSGTFRDSKPNESAFAGHLLSTFGDDCPFTGLAARAREKLTPDEYVALIQADRNATATAVYQQGLRDGATKALERQSRERKQRLARSAKQRGERLVDYVYFIRSNDAVKIGTSRNPERRLAVMQTGHPGSLAIEAICVGDAKVEKDYHARFAAHRLHGEWFSLSPEILAEIERLRASGEGSSHVL